MNILQPSNLVFFVGLVLFTYTRHVFITRTKNTPKVIRRVDSLEKILLLAMVPPTFLLPLLYLFTPLLAFADYALPVAVSFAGAIMMIISLWLFQRSHADLGANWSVSLELREGHRLIKHGVYRWIRHPMYAAIWLWAIAQGMLLRNWLAGWSMAPAFAAMYFLRTPREERLMYESFGDEYRTYASRTGRLFPLLWKREGEK